MKKNLKSVLLLSAALTAVTTSPALTLTNDIATNDSSDSTSNVFESTMQLVNVIAGVNGPTIESVDSELAVAIKMATGGQSTMSIEELTARFTTDVYFAEKIVGISKTHEDSIETLYNELIQSFVNRGLTQVSNTIMAFVSGSAEQLASVLRDNVALGVVQLRTGTMSTSTRTHAETRAA